MPDTISFIDAKINGDIIIDAPINNKPVYLLIDKNFPIDRLQASFLNYKLVFDKAFIGEKMEYFLRQVLEMQKKVGSSKDIQAADITLKDYLVKEGDFLLWIQKNFGTMDTIKFYY